jgi:hypothetical protein
VKWYTISQNNSGGFFIEDETVGIFVSVEADSEEAGVAKLQEVTQESGENWCECCGERWSFYRPEEGDVPTYYSEPLSTLKGYGRGDSVVLHYANGDVVVTQAGSEAE